MCVPVCVCVCVFVRVCMCVCACVRLYTKLRMYPTPVMSVLLYGAHKIWTIPLGEFTSGYFIAMATSNLMLIHTVTAVLRLVPSYI